MGDVAVATFAGYAEAAMWVEMLKSEGIPAVLVPLGFGAARGASAGLPHELRVREQDANRARSLLPAQDER